MSLHKGKRKNVTLGGRKFGIEIPEPWSPLLCKCSKISCTFSSCFSICWRAETYMGFCQLHVIQYILKKYTWVWFSFIDIHSLVENNQEWWVLKTRSTCILERLKFCTALLRKTKLKRKKSVMDIEKDINYVYFLDLCLIFQMIGSKTCVSN